jgi:glucose/arabinose dehydrogenase
MKPTRALVVIAAVAALLAVSCSGTERTAPHAQPVGEGSTTIPTAERPTTAVSATKVRLTRIAVVPHPTDLVPRAGTDELYVASQPGQIFTLVPSADGSLAKSDTLLLDLSPRVGRESGEQGLLGIAFSPDGSTLIASYTDGNDRGASVLDRYDVHGDEADPASRVELMRVPQPFPNHNGGHVIFGPDGYLWYGLGDGGSQGDPNDNGQNPKTLLATIMRIDPLHAGPTLPYTIPPDNPFVDGADGRPEVWLFGVRNPWRYSFDATTGDLWIGDVGGSLWEEVDLLTAPGRGRGANLGWSLREGAHDTSKKGRRPAGLVEPVFEYDHDEGISITGGYVYRGSRLPSLDGVYLYSDYGTSTLRALRVDGGKVLEATTLTTTGDTMELVVSFAQDNHRELYAVSNGGLIFRLDPS